MTDQAGAASEAAQESDTTPAALTNMSQSEVWEFSMADHATELTDLAGASVKDVRFDKIVQYAQELRPNVRCHLEPKQQTMGGNNVVRVIIFEDGERWIARIKMQPTEGQGGIARLKSDIDTMILLREEHSLPVPKIYGYSLTDEKAGRCFVLMEYMEGYSAMDLQRIQTQHPDRFKVVDGDERFPDYFLRSVAAFQARMSYIRFSKMGSLVRGEDGEIEFCQRLGQGPWTSAADYLNTWADWASQCMPNEVRYRQENCRSMEKAEADALWNSLVDFPESVRRIAATLQHTPSETYPIAHADLNLNNIIVDAEWNFKGVVDWDKSFTKPWEAATLPLFLHFKRPGLNKRLWKPPVDPIMLRWLELEAKYIGFVEEAEREYKLDNKLSSCLKDKRLQYLSMCLIDWWERHMYHYDYVETLFKQGSDS